MKMTKKWNPRVFRFLWGIGDQVWVVHFGSKSTPLIAQQLREIGIKSRVLNAKDFSRAWKTRPEDLKFVIFSGGDRSVFEKKAPRISPTLFQEIKASGITVLGICYGAQLLARLAGGTVERSATPEYDVDTVVRCVQGPFGRYRGGRAVMNHADEITQLPRGWKIYASTDRCERAFVGTGRLFATQFHPEMGHTKGGKALLKWLAYDVAGCTKDYSFRPRQFVKEAQEWARGLPLFTLAVCAFSGGVDSAVARQIMLPVFAERLHSVFVDNGFMRENEMEQIRALFGDTDIAYVKAAARFYRAVEQIPYVERKTLTARARAEGVYAERLRRAIGKVFFQIFSEVSEKSKRRRGLHRRDIAALLQGTNMADIIESLTKLKTHHNLVKLARALGMDIVEPLAGLYKSEIRKLAVYLGLPEEVAYRQPFPGPGLALRFSGRFYRQYLAALRKANAILEEGVAATWPNLRDPNRPCQYYVAINPAATVGIVGDNRVMGLGLTIRMVWSGGGRENYATLDVRTLPDALQRFLKSRLVNEVRIGSLRVTAVDIRITGKPPGTMELK